MTLSPAAVPVHDSDTRVRERFEELKAQLRTFWKDLNDHPTMEHTSVVVPSLSVNQEELAKVSGAAYYEERLLPTLIRLRSPGARLIYLTSQPIHPDTVEYYLQLLVGVPASHARRRLLLLSMQDSSSVPLTQKILERPRVLERLKRWIGDPSIAYITCYNSTALERSLAVELNVPLNGADPELLGLGTKSGSREVFRAAGVDLPAGRENLHTVDEVVDALVALHNAHPESPRAVVKINEGFAGEGNALFTFPSPWPSDGEEAKRAVGEQLHHLHWSYENETHHAFFRKFAEMGGIVEQFVEATDLQSPSTQLRIAPDGDVRIVSTHDQVLGSSTGQAYLGGRFPAREEYRELIQRDGKKIAQVLSERGVVGRFGVDFIVYRDAEGNWESKAVEINLRMGGTTPPFLALEFLSRGELDQERGVYMSHTGREKFYNATDNLKSPAYRGLLPEDLMDMLAHYAIRFDPATETGVLFYMIGALSRYGKLGVVSIGNSREEADGFYEKTVAILDQETGADRSAAHLHPLFDNTPRGM